MRFEKTIRARLKAMEIQYFLDDPDDDPSRFGDGMYYRVPGQSGWNGPWVDRQECRQMYREDLEFFFRSLQRRLDIYGAPPFPGKRRFLLNFSGVFDPNTFDVFFLLWNRDGGRMTAVIDARSLEEARELLSRCAFVTGDMETEEIDGNIDGICAELDLLHPLTAAAEVNAKE